MDLRKELNRRKEELEMVQALVNTLEQIAPEIKEIPVFRERISRSKKMIREMETKLSLIEAFERIKPIFN